MFVQPGKLQFENEVLEYALNVVNVILQVVH